MRKYRKPRRVKRKIPFYKKKIFWVFFLFFLFFSGNFYLTIFSPFFQIEKIEISGNEELKEGVEKLVRAQIAKNLFSFQTKSIFFFEPKKTIQFILEKFPQVEKVELLRKLPNKLELKIKERNPVIIFCSEKCFLIDEEGIAFKEFSGEAKFRIEGLNGEIGLGKVLIEKEILSKILEIREKMENDFKIPLEKIFLVSNERINVKTLEGWEIYFNPKKDIKWQLIKLRAVLEEEIPFEKRKDLEYIELRFGNFAPYKLRQ